MQAPDSRPPAHGKGFVAAAVSAPGLSAISFILGSLVPALLSEAGLSGLGSALFNLIFIVLIATIWGAVPSFVFGGLVLAVIRSLSWRRPPGNVVYLIGGVVAAGLYLLAGLWIARISAGAAMFFAPWAAPDLWPGNSTEAALMIASLLLSGAGAGLIYAGLAKRG
ncbi:MAG: hypothetical protein KAY20_05600 [Brevundimonas sp.]|nr:hypothetical protein [Brevundimonas sp.]